MTEEQVTKRIIVWLQNNGWEILSYDFPQSGTGISLRPEKEGYQSKNLDSVIPDIIAKKGNKLLLFENKNRFHLSDLLKIQNLKSGALYATSIQSLLDKHGAISIFYGIGLPLTRQAQSKLNAHFDLFDFAILVSPDIAIEVVVLGDILLRGVFDSKI